MKIKNCINAPKAVGAYSHIVETKNLIFFSGQLGLDPKTNQFVGESVEEQTRQAMKNIVEVLKEVGLTLKSICKATIFMADMNDFQVINNIYIEYMGDHKPARSAIQAGHLPLSAKVEIEIIAEKEDCCSTDSSCCSTESKKEDCCSTDSNCCKE